MNEPNVIWLVNPKVGSSRFTTSRLWSSVGSRPLKERRIAVVGSSQRSDASTSIKRDPSAV